LTSASDIFFFPLALQSQVQALHATTATAMEAVNTRGDTIATRL